MSSLILLPVLYLYWVVQWIGKRIGIGLLVSSGLLVWIMLATLVCPEKCADAVSPSCHATPGVGWRSPATRMTEARIPCDQFMAPAVPFNILSLPRVDFGGMVAIGATSYLDDVQLLPTMADDYRLRTMATVDQSRQRGVQLVDRRLVQNVDIHDARESILAEEHGPVKRFSGGWWGVWASLRLARLTEATELRLAPPSLGCLKLGSSDVWAVYSPESRSPIHGCPKSENTIPALGYSQSGATDEPRFITKEPA